MWVRVPDLFSMDVYVMFLNFQMLFIEVIYNFSLLHDLHSTLEDTFIHTKKVLIDLVYVPGIAFTCATNGCQTDQPLI